MTSGGQGLVIRWTEAGLVIRKSEIRACHHEDRGTGLSSEGER